MHELIDTTVMVHPELTFDPVMKQGHTGTITNIIHENDEIYVKFENGVFGLYGSDALLVLRPGPDLIANLRGGVETMPRADVLCLLNIYLLQQSGRNEDINEALSLAAFSEVLWSKALMPLNEWIDLGLSNDHDQTSNLGISR
jgi:hypothetical protein